MRKLLDSSVCIALLRGRPDSVIQRFLDANVGELCLCSIVAAELLVGALKAANAESESKKVREFLTRLPILGFNLAEAQAYAEIRHALESRGMRIGANDLIIAATAQANGLGLVTHNTTEFSRVANLQIEDWES